MKLTLRYKEYCDGCEKLIDLQVLGGYRRCELYQKNMLQDEGVFLAGGGKGYFKRLDECIKENEAEVKR